MMESYDAKDEAGVARMKRSAMRGQLRTIAGSRNSLCCFRATQRRYALRIVGRRDDGLFCPAQYNYAATSNPASLRNVIDSSAPSMAAKRAANSLPAADVHNATEYTVASSNSFGSRATNTAPDV